MDTIHKERILQLADHLDNIPDHRFSMYTWLEPLSQPVPDIAADPCRAATHFYNCETVGCIAGYACLLFVDPERHENPGEMPHFGMDFAGEAKRLLGLDYNQASGLFMPDEENDGLLVEYEKVTNHDAAVTLRNLATTGRADWNHVLTIG